MYVHISPTISRSSELYLTIADNITSAGFEITEHPATATFFVGMQHDKFRDGIPPNKKIVIVDPTDADTSQPESPSFSQFDLVQVGTNQTLSDYLYGQP